jgi:hypothetical protein
VVPGAELVEVAEGFVSGVPGDCGRGGALEDWGSQVIGEGVAGGELVVVGDGRVPNQACGRRQRFAYVEFFGDSSHGRGVSAVLHMYLYQYAIAPKGNHRSRM